MSYLRNMEANCECQYTVTLMDEVIHRQFSETKDNFNHVPSIHEVDEVDTDSEEYICDAKTTTPKDIKPNADETQENILEDSLYGNESFCSDESCDESEDANVVASSFSNNRLSFRSNNHKCTENDANEKVFENQTENREVVNSIRSKSSISEGKSDSLKLIRSKRRNMSFTEEELRKIEWENQLLLRKIMAQQNPKDKILRNNMPQQRTSSSAINRKKLQKKIENENILLLQRIQRTKSRVANTTRNLGCRQTIFERP